MTARIVTHSDQIRKLQGETLAANGAVEVRSHDSARVWEDSGDAFRVTIPSIDNPGLSDCTCQLARCRHIHAAHAARQAERKVNTVASDQNVPYALIAGQLGEQLVRGLGTTAETIRTLIMLHAAESLSEMQVTKHKGRNWIAYRGMI